MSHTLLLRIAASGFAALLLLAPSLGQSASFTGRVASVSDGDTITLERSLPAPLSTREVRLLSIDAPETFFVDGVPAGDQVVHGRVSRDALRSLLPRGTQVTIVTDRIQTDAFGRVLAHVYRGSLNLNAEMLRRGHAVTYVRWPNSYGRFTAHRAALQEARLGGRGMWNPSNPIDELPFEYRLRVNERTNTRYFGDFSTKTFVRPADYRRIPIEQRLSFASAAEASAAGYRLQ